ncbi:hypothetical protein ABZ260_14190 [Streptosporangium sp. NPDC006013]
MTEARIEQIGYPPSPNGTLASADWRYPSATPLVIPSLSNMKCLSGAR